MTRIAVIEKDKCNPAKCGNFLCIRLCPVNRGGEECIFKAGDGKAGIDEALCTGCGICPKRCPFGAIHIINLPEELDSQPIHQYGENGFHLYNLPTPIFGKVVGIIGRNGIGKSTAIKVLAGVLNPNLGNIDKKETDYKELIEFFKGSEAQLFFEKVRDGEITVAYKPQAIDQIPKQYKGKVKSLLKKVDEKDELKKIAELLDIKKILNNDVNKISGGELQRVAIAATVLKKANFYIFDEPSSFLDIKQRIRVSKFIRNLADEDTAVMVVEHDLIILDYMTDLIHLMYGKENAYGIVGLTKSTRAGINVYLGGYLKEANVRFRDHAIKFDIRPPAEIKEGTELVNWKDIENKFENFSLKAKQGSLYKNHVTGVVGENGIGKTTFVRILAADLKQDKGNVNEKIKVSYKPQYLETKKEPVAAVLKDAIKNYNNQLILPLGLKNLLDKNLDELSGGQLQRVAIALCLSQDAKLFLLDEPSAYLDIEQRLIVSKVIGDMMKNRGCSALVVDHDLLFIDYLSDTMMVFDGEPAVHGEVKGVFGMESGMNMFLSDLDITLRRDPESKRPRINKPGSQMDRKQKKEGKLYYS